ncbi:MAG: YkgJ family cysteine cluster protein [Desulfobacterales bacterium]|nr:YkgJ family cysteine cluster protein [Desulfobacterales bacterium]
MDFDFAPYFKKYEALVALADETFNKIKKEYPVLVRCETKCSDCCHALFDVSLVEALYINHNFNKTFDGKKRADLLEKANRADRKVYQIKRQINKDSMDGKNEVEIFMNLSKEKVRCPLLNENDMCDLYDYRPITCRVYGVPTQIQGMGHTCGKSEFEEGRKYPTINLDIIQKKLFELSAEITAALKTKYVKAAEMLVPVSMALITSYDDAFFGLADDKNDGATSAEKGESE